MITYNVVVYVNGYKLNGSFCVMAENYDEAFKEAFRALNEKTSMPGTLCLGITYDDVEIESSNAGKMFEKELKNALDKYSSDNIDIVYDEETYKYRIIFHSKNNSFSIFGIEAVSFIFKDRRNPEDWLKKLADKYCVGYCLR